MDHDQGQLAAFLAACAQALAFQALAQAVGVVHIAEGRHLEHEIIQGRAVRRRLGLGRGRRFFGSGLGRALGGIAPGRQSVVRRLVERIRALGGRGRGRCGGCVGSGSGGRSGIPVGSGRGAAHGLPAQVGQFVAQARVFGTGHGLVHLGQGLPVGTADAGQFPHLFAGVLAVAHHIAHEEGPAYAGQHDDADGPRGQGRQREAETALGHSGSDTLADLSQRLGHRIYMASGALTPSRSRPLRSTWLTARSRARRERVRAVSSASST